MSVLNAPDMTLAFPPPSEWWSVRACFLRIILSDIYFPHRSQSTRLTIEPWAVGRPYCFPLHKPAWALQDIQQYNQDIPFLSLITLVLQFRIFKLLIWILVIRTSIVKCRISTMVVLGYPCGPWDALQPIRRPAGVSPASWMPGGFPPNWRGHDGPILFECK
jgi:hypothetical protein